MDDVASLGYMAVRATVNFEIVFLCVPSQKYRPETSRINFYVSLVFIGNTSTYACVFVA